ncbi:MAG: alpha-galactosidase [Oscillospiraceae bacterium]|nr:alpha-galactosidase [Oscillospiraceae bacterium]
MKCEIRYRRGGQAETLAFSGAATRGELRMETAALTAVLETDEKGVLRLTLTPREPVELEGVTVALPFRFHRSDALFLNGYQSWTDSEELSVRSIMPGLLKTPRIGQKLFHLRAYGDYDFAHYSLVPGELHGWTYAYVRRDGEYRLFGSLSERAGFTQLRFLAHQNRIELARDCAGRVITESYPALEVAQLVGAEDEVFDRWFALQGIAPPTAKPIRGYTSWYNYYQDISEEKILKNLDALAASPVKFDVFQIDDGFQTHVGDWLSIDKTKFPNGLKCIADRVRALGMTPGLWLNPFGCEYGSETAAQHPDWLLRGDDGEPIRAGANWGGFWVWDFYNPEAREYVRKCLQTAVRDWGFGLLKLDFLYAVCLHPTAERTRGEIMCEAMDFIREATEGALILGCGVPLGAAFGKVDYCRIGCDVGLDYNDKLYMRIIHRERVSTKYSMRNTVFRRQLSGRAFLNDPDVFLLRHDNISLTWAQRETLAAVNGQFGGVLFTSDDVSGYDEKQQAVLERTLYGDRAKKVSTKRVGTHHFVELDGKRIVLE